MILKRIFFIAALALLTAFTAKSQVVIIDSLTVEELVNDYLLGEGVEATNITFNGTQADSVYIQIGLYQSEGDLIEFDEGVTLATYDVNNINNTPADFITNSITDDPDLVAIAGAGTPMNDCAILEFDFIVSSDSVKFNYVFASNEYSGYTCSQYNDAFGFFLSGPGIAGPFSNDAINIALIPNSDIPVAINTINSGIPDGDASFCEDANPNWQEDTQYFVNNPSFPPNEISLPGMTVTLTAEAAVQCGEEYHIKLAIGDAFDNGVDSGVFLEAGSFSAFGEIFAEFNPVFNEGGAVTQPGYDSIVVAGCTSPIIELIRPTGATFSTIEFEFEGNAVEGIDYVVDGEIPGGFPEGVDTVAFAIDMINPNITDTIFFELLIIYETCAGVNDTTILEIPIAPPPQIDAFAESVDVVCPADSLVIDAFAEGGLLPHIFDWQDFGMDEDGASIFIELPLDEQEYTVVVTDQCEFVYDTVVVSVTNSVPPPLQVSIDPFADPTCPNEPVDLSVTVNDGNPPYFYQWEDSNNNSYSDSPFSEVTIEDINQVAFGFTPALDVFSLITDSCGTQVSDSVTINYPLFDSLMVSFTPLVDNCPEGLVELEAIVEGGAGDFVYTWGIDGESTFADGFGESTSTTYIDPGRGFNTFSLVVQDRCNIAGYDMFLGQAEDGTLLLSGLDFHTQTIPFIKLDPLPNIITPNGDGQNEVFVVPGIDAFENASVLIYDRWGKLIYESSSYDAGTSESTVSQGFSADGFSDGTYFYVVNIDSGECVTQGNLEVVGGSE